MRDGPIIDQRLLQMASVFFSSVPLGRFLAGLLALHYGFALLSLPASFSEAQSPVPAAALGTSAPAGLGLMFLGILLLADKVEFLLTQGNLIVGAGVASIFLGYRLFLRGVETAESSAFTVAGDGYKLLLSGQGPGLFFMVFGAMLIGFYAWTHRPQAALAQIEADAERLRSVDQQKLMAVVARVLSPHLGAALSDLSQQDPAPPIPTQTTPPSPMTLVES